MTATANEMSYLQRKHLPHHIPPWVTQGARHFITINARQRGATPFTSASVATALLQGLLAYESIGKWHIWLALVMPDHLHFIATFNLDYGLTQSVTSWKGYQAKTLKIAFQTNFFEHRLRDDNAFIEKAIYIRENPVRKGLVARAEEWPYCIDRAPHLPGGLHASK
jgi:putative transposase